MLARRKQIIYKPAQLFRLALQTTADCVHEARHGFAHHHLKEQIRADLVLEGKAGACARTSSRDGGLGRFLFSFWPSSFLDRHARLALPGCWCGRPDLNRHSSFEPRDFLTSYGFRRRPIAQREIEAFVVWTIPSPFALSRL